MEIGIITYWDSNDNYGQILQVFALQKTLTGMGHRPFLIRYTKAPRPSDTKGKIIKIFKIYPLLQILIHKLNRKENVLYKQMISNNQLRDFSRFKKEYLNSSFDCYHSIQELRQSPPQADCYITGSDQVWLGLADCDSEIPYYLDFGDSKTMRISYAASFGRKTYPEKSQKALKEQLSKFQGISVRESDGVEICKNIGLEAKHVIDPTLLLGLDYYKPFLHRNADSSRYIFLYVLNINSSDEIKWNVLNKYAKEESLETKITNATGHIIAKRVIGGVKYDYPTIPEWINNIYNAEFVGTTSFHGVVFSIILHKNFIFYPLKGKFSSGNNRVLDLLKTLNLLNKVYTDNCDLHNIIEQEIDWKEIDKIIETLRKDSIDWLKINLDSRNGI